MIDYFLSPEFQKTKDEYLNNFELSVLDFGLVQEVENKKNLVQLI